MFSRHCSVYPLVIAGVVLFTGQVSVAPLKSANKCRARSSDQQLHSPESYSSHSRKKTSFLETLERRSVLSTESVMGLPDGRQSEISSTLGLNSPTVVALDEAGQFDCQANGTRPPPPSTADSAKWTLAFYLGGTRTVPSTLTISQPQRRNRMTFDPVHFSGKSFDGPVYYGARVRYQFGGIPWFGVETEFIHSKVYADTRQSVHVAGQRDGQPISRRVLLQEIVQQYSISHGVNLLLFNAAFQYPLRSRQAPLNLFSFTGRVGIGPTVPHTESSIEGRRQEQYEWGRVAWQASGGIEIQIHRGLIALMEYKFTRTNQRGSVSLGVARSLLRTHHGVFGLGYRF
jgi:opacity protein-like surface antigen